MLERETGLPHGAGSAHAGSVVEFIGVSRQGYARTLLNHDLTSKVSQETKARSDSDRRPDSGAAIALFRRVPNGMVTPTDKS